MVVLIIATGIIETTVLLLYTKETIEIDAVNNYCYCIFSKRMNHESNIVLLTLSLQSVLYG